MIMDSVYSQLARDIIQHQESIIGPVAISRARQVSGLALDWDKKTVQITKEPKHVIDALVAQYKVLFGQISVEVCKEAADRFSQQLNSDQLPASLR